MLRRTTIGLTLAFGFFVLQACGSSSDDDSGSGGSGTGGAAGKASGGSGATAGTSATGGTGGSSSADATVIAQKLTDPIGLALDDSYVYVACYDNEGTGGGGIFKVPLGGGKLEQLADEPHPESIAVDADYVYYLAGDLTDAATFSRVKKDGSGAETLADSLTDIGSSDSENDPDFFLNGDSLYFIGSDGTDSGVARLPARGGSVEVLIPNDPTGLTFPTQVLGADATGIFYLQENPTVLTELQLMHAKLDGTGAASIATRDTAFTYASDRLLSGKLFWVEQDGVDVRKSSAHSLSSRGADSTLATLDFPGANYITSDDQGTFVTVDAGGDSGVYAIDASGKVTKVHADDNLEPGEEGSPRLLVSDARQIYWVSGGFIHEQAELHAMAR